MRGFPSALPLFDGASHGFATRGVNLSNIDHEKRPQHHAVRQALGSYGGAADYTLKTPAAERSVRGAPPPGASAFWPPNPSTVATLVRLHVLRQ